MLQNSELRRTLVHSSVQGPRYDNTIRNIVNGNALKRHHDAQHTMPYTVGSKGTLCSHRRVPKIMPERISFSVGSQKPVAKRGQAQ